VNEISARISQSLLRIQKLTTAYKEPESPREHWQIPSVALKGKSAMCRCRFLAAGLTALMLSIAAGPLADRASASSITVLNNSFESPITNNGGASPPTSWSGTGTFGTYQAVNTQYPAGSNGLSGGAIVPDGSQAAYLASNGASLYQLTSTALAANTTYTLNFWLGQRNDFTAFTTITAELFTGASPTSGTVIANQNYNDPSSGHWLQETLTFTTGATVSGNIGIAFVNNSANQSNIDFVTLTTPDPPPAVGTPEPASLTLIGFGLVAIGGYHWRRRRQCVA